MLSSAFRMFQNIPKSELSLLSLLSFWSLFAASHVHTVLMVHLSSLFYTVLQIPGREEKLVRTFLSFRQCPLLVLEYFDTATETEREGERFSSIQA